MGKPVPELKKEVSTQASVIGVAFINAWLSFIAKWFLLRHAARRRTSCREASGRDQAVHRDRLKPGRTSHAITRTSAPPWTAGIATMRRPIRLRNRHRLALRTAPCRISIGLSALAAA